MSESPALSLDLLPLAALLADQSGRWTYANEEAARLLGRAREDLLAPESAPALPFVGEDGQPLRPEDFPSLKVMRLGQPWNGILGLLRTEGEVAWLDLTATPLPDGRILILFLDITPQTHLKHLLAARSRIREVALRGTLEEVLRRTLDEAEDLTGSCIGFYHFVEPDQVTLSLQAWSTRTEAHYCRAQGKGEHYAVDKAGVWVDAIRQGRSVVHNDYMHLPHRKGLPEGHAALIREAVVTVRRQGKVLAILGVGNKPTPYTEGDVRRLEDLADLAWEIAEFRRAQERLHLRNLALEQAQHAFVLTDSTGILRYVNPAFLRYWGYTSADEVLGRPRQAFWVDRDEAQAMVGEAQGVGVATRELVALRQDGSTFLAEARLSQVKDAEGRVIAMLGTATDVTARREAQEAIQAQKAMLEQFFMASVDLLCLATFEGRFLKVNEAWTRLLGYPVQDLEGIAFLRLIHPEDRDATVQAMARLANHEPLLDFVTRFQDHEGRWRHLEWRAMAQDGLICASARDITERRAQDDLLRGLHDRLALVSEAVAQSPVSVVITSLSGTIDYVNPAFERITGYRAEEALGRNPRFLKSGKQPPETYQALWKTLTAGNSWEGRFHNRRRDGSPLWVQARISPIRDGTGRIVRYLALEEDITEAVRLAEERRHLEAQLIQSQKLESLGSLAGGVAHDMNNVLMAILGLATALRATEPGSGSRARSLDTIVSACQKGGRMVRSLLDFARKGASERRDLDFNALIREEMALLERTTFREVSVVVDLDPELPAVHGDSSALSHALMNLCVNAVDAMEGRGGGTLTLSTRRDADGWVVCTIEDTGCGMPPEVLARAMDPYFTTKPEGKGTGLGLAMAYGTLQAHSGTLSIHTEVGRGTRITLRLPGVVQAAPTDPAEAAPEPEPRPMRVLVVDDDDLVRASTESLLELLGAQVTCAEGGTEALALLGQGPPPDLVILDMNMPGLSGPDTLPRLRARHPELPVVLATGRADGRAMDLLSRHTQVFLLSKPYSLQDLKDMLAQVGPLRRAEDP